METADEICRRGWSYAERVVSGEIDAGSWVRKACRKALAWRENPPDGVFFHPEKAARPVQFAGYCQHLKGPMAGQPIRLEDWQVFATIQIYGWLRADGLRVVRTVYFEVPRKNGKSTWLSVLCVYHLVADNEPGAEVYSSGVTRDQARIVFGDAQAMVRASPNLSKMLGVHRSAIFRTETNSKFEPLSADAGSLEGKSPSFSVVDEVHVHKTPEVWDVLNVASGARAQPLIFGITTAGTNREGVAYQLREYLTKVLDGHVDDPTFFGVIYSIDETDDWREKANWIKANPNYGVSVQPDDLDRLFLQAQESPSAETNFRTKRLNEWRNATDAWILSADWEACNDPRPPIETWRGQPCYIGLDLASVSDFACVSVLFPQPPKVHVYMKSYLPLDTIRDRSGAMGETFRSWMEQGYIIATDGNVTDLSYIKEEVLRLCEMFKVREIAYDPWGANELSADLLDRGLPMVKVPQSIASMSDASKEFEKLIKARRLVHGNDPVLSWMVSNAVIYTDVNENIKVKKETQAAKIDGVVATIMALGRLKVNGGLIENPYERRGIRTL